MLITTIISDLVVSIHIRGSKSFESINAGTCSQHLMLIPT